MGFWDNLKKDVANIFSNRKEKNKKLKKQAATKKTNKKNTSYSAPTSQNIKSGVKRNTNTANNTVKQINRITERKHVNTSRGNNVSHSNTKIPVNPYSKTSGTKGSDINTKYANDYIDSIKEKANADIDRVNSIVGKKEGNDEAVQNNEKTYSTKSAPILSDGRTQTQAVKIDGGKIKSGNSDKEADNNTKKSSVKIESLNPNNVAPTSANVGTKGISKAGENLNATVKQKALSDGKSQLKFVKKETSKYLTDEEKTKKYSEYSKEITQDPDFEKYVVKGANIDPYGGEDNKFLRGFANFLDASGTSISANPLASRKERKEKNLSMEDKPDSIEEYDAVKFLTPEEEAVINAALAKDGPDKARELLYLLDPELQKRKSANELKQAEELKANQKTPRGGNLELTSYMVKNTIKDSFNDLGEGINQELGNQYAKDTYSAAEINKQDILNFFKKPATDENGNIIKDENGNTVYKNTVGSFVLEGIDATAAQTPQLLAGLLTGGLGKGISTAASLGTMGLNTMSSLHQKSREEGHSEEEAKKYALFGTTKEIATELMFGIVPGVSKDESGILSKLASKVSKGLSDNKIFRDFIFNSLEEGAEEYIGTAFFEPIVNNLAYGEDINYTISNTILNKEAWHDFTIGTIAGTPMSAVNTVSQVKTRSKVDNQLNKTIKNINTKLSKENQITNVKDLADNLSIDGIEKIWGAENGYFNELYSRQELNKKFGEKNTSSYLRRLKSGTEYNNVNNQNIKGIDLSNESILTDNKGNITGIQKNNIDTNNQVQSFNQSTDKVITNEYVKENISNELPYRFTDNINQSYVNNVKDNITMILDTDVRGYDFSLKEGSVDALINDKTNNITKNDISKISNMLAHYDVMEKNGPGINIIKQVGNDTYTLGLTLDTNEQRIVVTDYRKFLNNNVQNNILPLNNQQNNLETFNKIANKIGAKVEYINDNVSQNIDGYVKDGVIYLNRNNKNAEFTTFKHELVHYIRSKSEKLYNELEVFSLEEINKNSKYQARKAEIESRYLNAIEKGEIDYTSQDIQEEIVADFIARRIFENDEAMLTRLVNNNKTLFEAIRDFIKKIKSMITKNDVLYSDIKNADELFERVYKKLEKQETEKNNNKIKYHYSSVFTDEIDKTLNGKLKQDTMVKARDYTPDFLTNLGIKNLPMLMTQNHVLSTIYTKDEAKNNGVYKDNVNYHGLGKQGLIDAIDSLDNPIRVFRYKDKGNTGYGSNHFIFETKIKDYKNRTILVPIELYQKGNYNDIYIDNNFIPTVFGARNTKTYLDKKVESGDIEEIKKKNLQVSETPVTITGPYNKNNSSNHNISQNEDLSTENDDTAMYSLKEENVIETDTEKLLKQVKQMQEEMKRQQEEYTKQINNMQKEIDNLKSGTVSNNQKRKGSAYTNDNKQINFEYDIVNINDLITSHDIQGNINNNYPQNLQPRDRQRDASYEQIRSIAANLNPSRLMASSNVTDGAPIIGNDNVVESGNGRVIALNLAMQNYIQNMSDYQNYLNKHKSEYGFDDRDIKLGDILVRRRTSEVNREDFVRKANESTISTLNATEQAKIDAEKLSDEVLNMFIANDEGIIQTKDNENFIKAFVYNVIPENEKNSFIDINGNLTKEGITRIENAIFAKAYNMDETLISRLAEVTNDDARNISKALLMVASNTIKIKQGIKNNEYYNLDFSEDIAKGAKLYLELKRNSAYNNTNNKVDLYISQTSLIDDNISSEAKAMSYVFEQLKSSPVKINDYITSMYDIIKEIGSPNQVSLLGSKEYTKGDIIRYGEIAFNKQSGQSLEARLRYEQSRGVSENDGQQKQTSEEEIRIAKYIADKVNSKKLEKKKAVKTKNIKVSKAQDNTGAFLNEKKTKSEKEKKQSNSQDFSAIYANQRYIFDENGNVVRIERKESPFLNTFDNEVFKANAIKKLPLPEKNAKENIENSMKIKGAVKVINKINDIIGKEVKKGNLSKEESITYFNEFDKLGQALVNDGYYIEKFGKKIKNDNFKLYYNNILHSYKAAETCLGAFQVDFKGKRVGESVYKILEPVMDRMDDFNDYLHHRLNIDRWKTDKAIDKNISAMTSLSIVQKYERENKDFHLAAQKVYNYIRKINDMYIDAGISTRERQDMLEDLYPNYVPLMYKDNPFDTKINKSKISAGTTVSDPVKKAKGGGGFENLESIDVVLARMTVGAHKKVRLNELFKEFYAMFEEGKTYGLVDIRKIGDVDVKNLDEELSQIYSEMITVENGNTFNFYKDGLKFQMALDPYLAESILKLNQGDRGSLYENIGAVGLRKAVNVFKQLQTSWKPSFILRNFARDFTDSLWYTDSLKDYFKTTPKAIQEVYKGLFTKKGSKYWDLYESLGGISNSYFEDGIFHMKNIKGTKENRSRINRALNTIPDLNLMVEQIPRMTEFIKTLNRAGFDESNLSKIDYNTAVSALWNADDITLNFGRGSQFTRKLNRYAVPFLNPTVQGSAKFFRHISDNFSKGLAVGLGQLMTRAVIYGVPLYIANDLIMKVIESLYADDDEEKKKMQEAYDNLTDYNKNSNFLIYKGDGQFTKIPKGRIIAGITTIGGDAYKAIIKGEDIDIRESLGFMLEQINPMNINFIWDPLVQAKNNKNYYGGDIESDFMQELPVNERYDENTDEISKFIANTPLGKALNLSPKKVNYVIDQYSGVGGELILPFFTQSGLIGGEDNAKDWLKNTASTTWKNMWSPLTVDTAYSNKYSSEYAELKEKINQESTSEYRNKKYVDKNGKTLTTPTYLKSKMFDNVDKEIAKLYQEQSKIYNDDNLTNQEKSEKLREISLQINQKKKDMVTLYNQVSPLLDKEYKNNKSKYTKSQKSSYELYDALNNILVNKIGSDASCEMAINFIYSDENNKSNVKMKQQITLLKNNGISYKDIASYFVYANDVQYTPKDEIGDKQNALLKKVNSLNLSKEQKALLLFSTPSWTDRYNDNEILNRYEVKGGQLGYSTTYEAREDVANYIINANHLSQKQKLEMAELAGFEIGEDEGGKYIKW